MIDEEKDFVPTELDDAQLEGISGGYEIGSVVNIHSGMVKYCPGCGRLIMNIPATITGVRGVLDGKTLYWVTYSCCGYRSSSSETAFR
jgi:hypothetical protein